MNWFSSRVSVPRWWVLLGAAVALAAGVALGAHFGQTSKTATDVRHGVVDSVDDGGAICVRGRGQGSQVECYRAPGVGVKAGDEIGYRLRSVEVDPDDPGKGSELVLVWEAPAG